MSNFVYDDLTGIPTILAASRADRPDQTGAEKKVKASSRKKENVDFFAKGNENLTPPAVYLDQEDWNVRVFPNKFPFMETHEIIVHSPYLKKDLEDLPIEQNARYLRAVLNRVEYYTQQGKEVFLFNNRGARAGASLAHPHSQLVAAKGFAGNIELEKDGALHYFNSHNSCYWCDMLKAEKELGSRVVFESTHFMLLAPKASRWGYETKLFPKKHTPNISLIEEYEIMDLAALLKAVLTAYDRLLDRPERNFWLHSQIYEPYHWFFTFMPRISVMAGLELGAGIWVNGRIAPEDAARELGGVVADSFGK